MKTNTKQFNVLYLFVILCLVVEAIGGLFTAVSVHDWYLTLHKPSWNPPSYVFAPVWTVLYLMMAFAIWLIWTKETVVSKKTAYICFSIQLGLNLIWSALFFTLKCPAYALIDITFLLFFILATIFCFYKICHVAAYLLLPYLFWVIFAACLNATIWYLN